MLVQIKADHFTAGIELESNIVVRAPPILHYMIGWRRSKVYYYVKMKGWEYQEVK